MLDKILSYGILPIQATNAAESWDQFYSFVFWLSTFFFVLVIGLMAWFAYRYSKKNNPKPAYISHNTALEVMWTAVPTVLLMVIFYWGWVVYKEMVQAPSDAMEVRVVGKQWLWNFQYDDGRVTTNELYVPLQKPVKLVMSSEDVVHSFFVPNFRVKQDVVPGIFTTIWFKARIAGRHQVFCTEYCGTAHSAMLAHVNVLPDELWKEWRKGKNVKLASDGNFTLDAKEVAKPVSMGMRE